MTGTTITIPKHPDMAMTLDLIEPMLGDLGEEDEVEVPGLGAALREHCRYKVTDEGPDRDSHHFTWAELEENAYGFLDGYIKGYQAARAASQS